MRAFVFGLFLSVAVLLPNTGNGQVYQFRTPPPTVSAAASDWQVNSAPIFVNSLIYYPTSTYRFFDGQVLAQVGVVDRVPVYGDTTLEPFSLVYVPVSRDRVREYERRRDAELAGTTGSRVPSFPVESPSVQGLRRTPPTLPLETSGTFAPTPQIEFSAAPAVAPAAPTGTPAAVEPSTAPSVGTGGLGDRGLSRRTLVETIPRPTGSNGVWLEFNGARYYADGPAITFSPERFEPLGDYRGFAVYREKAAGRDAIWISVVKNGPVAPYVRR